MTEPLLICTDLDRTLLPNGQQPESPEARPLFKQLVSHSDISLAYVSGRHRALVEEAICEYDLPAPDYVIADVGTTIYHVDPQGWHRQRFWDEVIAPDWSGHDHAGINQLLQDFVELQLQEVSKQNRYKLSYYAALNCDRGRLLTLIGERLSGSGIKANLIWSVDEQKHLGLLDVLPASASKFHAIECLMKRQGFDYTNAIFCGDSGNDIEVLASPIPSVLVANCQKEVRRQATLLADELGYSQQLYIAEGGFLGMNGNYSAGMLEGIAYFHPNIRNLLAIDMEMVR